MALSDILAGRSGHIKTYRSYRKTQNLLNGKIVKTLDREVFIKAAKLLGVLRGNQLILDSESEMDYVMDFALNDYYVSGKNTIRLFLENEKDKLKRREAEILEALLKSYSSLFLVLKTDPGSHTIKLADRFDETRSPEITDIGLSESLPRGALLFARVVSFKDFSMTSGISFVFNRDIETRLRRQFDKFHRKLSIKDENAGRFVCFFKLHQKYGYDVSFR